MKAEAPQAPVSPGEKSPKNRKTHGKAHSDALERGPDKGSAFYQELMSARAELKNAGLKLVPPAEGLKGSEALAALLKVSRLSVVDIGLIAAAEASKRDASRKAAHAKGISSPVDAEGVHVHPDSSLKDAAGKEKKTEAAELSKAPLVEGKAQAVRAEPLIRILDLRRAEKGSAAVESPEARRVSLTADKDPAGGFAPRPAAARDTVAETLPKPVPATTSQSPLERLREMAGSELLRATHLVLKDGGGEIRLVLKPESLGSVRIRMNVVDNAIEGRIIVDSSAVKHVIDGSVDALRRALTAEGFQAGALQVSVGGQNADSGDHRPREQGEAVRRIAARGFERNVPGTEDVSLGDMFVNMFV